MLLVLKFMSITPLANVYIGAREFVCVVSLHRISFMLCASAIRYGIIRRFVLLWDAYRLLLCFVSEDFGIVKRWHEGDDWYDLIVFKRKWILDKLYVLASTKMYRMET